MQRMKASKFGVPVLAVLFVVMAGTAFYFYNQVSTLQQDPQAAARKEAEQLVGVVKKLIILPEGELPTVATVSDPTKLKDQAFFAKAKVGDKVLLYAAAKKAYLYDPKANRILEVAPITIDSSAGTSAPAIQEEPEPAVDEEEDATTTDEPAQ